MEEVTSWLVAFFIALVALALLFEGIAWVVVHEWPWLVLGGSILLVALVLWLTRRRASPASELRGLRDKAGATARQVERARQALEREAGELAAVRLRGDADFHQLTRKHHESRLTADAWHRHKNDLSEEIERGSESLTRHNRQTADLRDHIVRNCGARGRRWGEELEKRKALLRIQHRKIRQPQSRPLRPGKPYGPSRWC